MPFWKRTPRPPVPIMDAEGEVLHACPRCGGGVRWHFTCHTWGGNPDGTGWKHCLPCDSAMEFYCEGTKLPLDPDYAYVGCGWGYTWGLNPRNPRSAYNERERPAWLGTRTFDDWLVQRGKGVTCSAPLRGR